MARTPKNTAAAEVSDYFTLTPIEHDLVTYAPGSTLELTEAHATPLLAVGAITDNPTKAQLAALLAGQPEDEQATDPAPTE